MTQTIQSSSTLSYSQGLVSRSITRAEEIFADPLTTRVAKAVAIPIAIIALGCAQPYLFLDPTTTQFGVACATLITTVVLPIFHYYIQKYWADQFPDQENNGLSNRVELIAEPPKDTKKAAAEDALNKYNKTLKELESTIEAYKKAVKETENTNKGKVETCETRSNICEANETLINDVAERKKNAIKEIMNALEGIEAKNQIIATISSILERENSSQSVVDQTLNHSIFILKEPLTNLSEQLNIQLENAIHSLYLTVQNAPRPEFIEEEIRKQPSLGTLSIGESVLRAFIPSPEFVKGKITNGPQEIKTHLAELNKDLKIAEERLKTGHRDQQDLEKSERLKQDLLSLEDKKTTFLLEIGKLNERIQATKNQKVEAEKKYELACQAVAMYTSIGLDETQDIVEVPGLSWKPLVILEKLKTTDSTSLVDHNKKVETIISTLNGKLTPLRTILDENRKVLYRLASYFSARWNEAKYTRENLGGWGWSKTAEEIKKQESFYDALIENFKVLYLSLIAGFAQPENLLKDDSFGCGIQPLLWNEHFLLITTEEITKQVTDYRINYKETIDQHRNFHTAIETLLQSIIYKNLQTLIFDADSTAESHYKQLHYYPEDLTTLPPVIGKAIQDAQEKIQQAQEPPTEEDKKSTLLESLKLARADEIYGLTNKISRLKLNLPTKETEFYCKSLLTHNNELNQAENTKKETKKRLKVLEGLITLRNKQIKEAEVKAEAEKLALKELEERLEIQEKKHRGIDYDLKSTQNSIDKNSIELKSIETAVQRIESERKRKQDLETRITNARKAEKLFTALETLSHLKQEWKEHPKLLHDYAENKRKLQLAKKDLEGKDLEDKKKEEDKLKLEKDEKEKDVEKAFTEYREALESIKSSELCSLSILRYETLIEKYKKTGRFYTHQTGRDAVHKLRYATLEKNIQIALARMELHSMMQARGEARDISLTPEIDADRLALAKQRLSLAHQEEVWKRKLPGLEKTNLIQALDAEIGLTLKYYTSKYKNKIADKDKYLQKAQIAILSLILDKMHIEVSHCKERTNLPVKYNFLMILEKHLEKACAEESGIAFMEKFYGLKPVPPEKPEESSKTPDTFVGAVVNTATNWFGTKTQPNAPNEDKSQPNPLVKTFIPLLKQEGGDPSSLDFPTPLTDFLNIVNTNSSLSDSTSDEKSKNGYNYTTEIIGKKIELIKSALEKPFKDDEKFTLETKKYIIDRDAHKRNKVNLKWQRASLETKHIETKLSNKIKNKTLYGDTVSEKNKRLDKASDAEKNLKEERERVANDIWRKIMKGLGGERVTYLIPPLTLWIISLAPQISPVFGLISLSWRAWQNILLVGSATHLFFQSFSPKFRQEAGDLSPATTGEGESSILADTSEPSINSAQPIPPVQNCPVGFPNLNGVTCYMNASLEVLFNIPDIRKKIEEKKNDNEIVKAVWEVMNEQDATQLPSKLETLITVVFKRRKDKGVLAAPDSTYRLDLKKKYQSADGIEKQTAAEQIDQLDGLCQHDAQEFLGLILASLDWFPLECESYIKVDEGTTVPKITRDNSLRIPLNSEHEISFQEALDHYFEGETMIADGSKIESFEGEVNGRRVTSKRYQKFERIKTFPNYLFVHLIRFDSRRNKIEAIIPFPENGIVHFKQTTGKPVDYEIVGYLNHHGSDIDGGHYTADIKYYKDPEGAKRWLHYNDEAVRLRPPNQPKKDAYMILLKRKSQS